MKYKKEGITLIALVVTIIVLIILAGVSINLVLGDNGIIIKAKEAREKHKEASVHEKVSMMLGEYLEEKYNEDKKLIEFLEEQVEKGKIQEVQDNKDGTYTIEVDGYEVIIREDDLSIIEIQKIGPRPQITNILITLEDGITTPEDYSVDIGTKLKIKFDANIEGGEITNIEPNIPYTTDGTELEKQFIVTGEVNGEEYLKKITISLKDKYMLREPEIILSNNEWTKDNITVSVNWFNDNEDFKREISIDGGETYQEYVGPIEVSKKCIVKAKISNDRKEAVGEKVVNKIDKLEPNNFTPVISDEISSTELQIVAVTQDQDENEEYGKSEIKGYIYYIYNGENLVTKSDLINQVWWNGSGLEVGNSYNIYVEAYDYADNMTRSDIISYEKLPVYVWEKYSVNAHSSYTYNQDQYTTEKVEMHSGGTFYFPKCDSISSGFDSSTGKWKGTKKIDTNEMTIGTYFLDGYYGTSSFTSDIMNHTQSSICYVMSRTEPTTKEGYYTVKRYKSFRETTYEKGAVSYGKIKSNNLEAYPSNGRHQDGYWYERVQN